MNVQCTPNLASAVADGSATAQAGTLHTSDTNGAWYRFVFATPPSLTAGTVYHIVCGRSGATDTSNYWEWRQLPTTAKYPHGNNGYGSAVPAWTAQTTSDFCFLVEPVTNMLTSAGQFDGKVTFSEGAPLDQSEAMTQPLKNFFDHLEGTLSIVGASWTKDKTILDIKYGEDHDRIVLRCNATTGYLQLDVYDKQGTLSTITGTTDVSGSTVRRITFAYRAKGDGADFIKMYLHATAEGTPLTGLTMTFDPLMKELGNISLGGGFALAPTWTNDYTCTALPTAATPAWTYDGSSTEAAHAVVSGGKLFIQIPATNTDTCSWHIHPTFNNANGNSIICKHKVVKASDVTGEYEASVFVNDGTNLVLILFHTYYIEISYDHASTYVKYQLDLTKEHVFHIETKGSDLRLYDNGKVVFDGTGLFAHADASGATLCFGDIDATAGSNAESIWDYIKYHETLKVGGQCPCA